MATRPGPKFRAGIAHLTVSLSPEGNEYEHDFGKLVRGSTTIVDNDSTADVRVKAIHYGFVARTLSIYRLLHLRIGNA